MLAGVKNARGQYARLNKALYCLLQAPMLWFAHLACALRANNIDEAQCTNYPFKPKWSGQVSVLVYVDDYVIAGSSYAVFKVKKKLTKWTSTTEHGPCADFLRLAVIQSVTGIFLSLQLFTDKPV